MKTFEFSQKDQDAFQELHEILSSDESKAAYLKKKKRVDKFWKYLEDCETLFREERHLTEPYSEHMENMLALHHLNHNIPGKLTQTLRDIGLPESRVTPEHMDGHPIWDGWVAGDGTLYAISRFCQLDPNWVIVLGRYIHYRFLCPKCKHEFVTDDNPIELLTPAKPLKIAILGDWGTGKDWNDGGLEKTPAELVIEGIVKEDPDYIIHLGDVYYAGRTSEEQDHLMNMLPDGFENRLYTMNSNHEMYDGANALYEVAINSDRFSAQKGRTYFSLDVGDWTIIGLDSAYYDKSSLYMKGSIQGKKKNQKAQKAFLQREAKRNRPIILLTHHQGLLLERGGKTAYNKKLWKQVNKGLGRMPDIWYWGHVHNGIVFNTNIKKIQKCKTHTGQVPRLRCCGHASIPFGNAKDLHHHDNNEPFPSILYYAHTPLDAPNPTPSQHLRVLNGFAILTVDKAGVKEAFYEVSNNYDAPKQVWSS